MGDSGEISRTVSVARHDRRLRRPDLLASALVVGEKEHLVVRERPAECPASLMAIVVPTWDVVVVVEPVVRVQLLIAEELEPDTMKLVGAGFRDHVHQAAAVMSVFGIEA